MDEVKTSLAPVSSYAPVGSYVEWGAVLAGAVTALAISFVLLAFGSAVGLSAVSPWTTGSATAKAVSMGAVLWLILVNVWAFALGGYLAGRMRHRWSDAANTGDGAHGLLVWASAVTLAAIVAAGSAAAIGRGAAEGVGAVAARSADDPVNSAVDALLRPTRPPAEVRADDTRGETARLLLRAAGSGETAAADRTYLAQLVAARTGLSEADASKRVGEVIDSMKRAAARARKVAVVLGFLTAATLLLGAAAAWWGASVGGRHRDEGTVWLGLARVETYF